MKRERKYSLALTVIGGLTLPVFVGIPLLAIGILLLVKEDRVNAEGWIRVLFWIALAALTFGFALVFLLPSNKSSEGGMERTVLIAMPVGLAMLVGLALAALTLARFKSLATKDRILGLGFGSLTVLGLGIALVMLEPGMALGIALISVAVWAVTKWYWRRQARRVAAMPNPPAAMAEPGVPVPHFTPPALPPEPPALAVKPLSPRLQLPPLPGELLTPPLEPQTPIARPPKPPRVEKPLYGILAWVLPLSAILVGYLMTKSWDQKDGIGITFVILPPAWSAIPLLFALCTSSRVRRSPLRILALLLPPVAVFGFMWLINSQPANGFEGWGLLFCAALPLTLGLGAAPILALNSLRRRERYPALAVTLLALYVLPCVVLLVALCCGAIAGAWHDHGEALQEWMGVILVVGILLLAGGVFWWRRTSRVASGIHTVRGPVPHNKPGATLKKKAIGVLLVAVAIALAVYGLWMLFLAGFFFLGGPDLTPSKMGECRIYGTLFGLFGLALLAGGIKVSKFGISLVRAKPEPAESDKPH